MLFAGHYHPNYRFVHPLNKHEITAEKISKSRKLIYIWNQFVCCVAEIELVMVTSSKPFELIEHDQIRCPSTSAELI